MSNVRIREAINNRETNIAYLATLPDKKLAEKLEVIYLQSEIAVQKNQIAAFELLEVWRSQVIEARIYKAENNIPDVANKIELAIADIETFTAKTEERQEIMEENIRPSHPSRIPKNILPDNDSQLELF